MAETCRTRLLPYFASTVRNGLGGVPPPGSLFSVPCLGIINFIASDPAIKAALHANTQELARRRGFGTPHHISG